MYKTGDKVIIEYCGELINGWPKGELKRTAIVLWYKKYKTIDNIEKYYDSYCAFDIDGHKVLFAADNNTDYILGYAEETKSQEFKVGDWIVCVTGDSGAGVGWELDNMFRVDRIVDWDRGGLCCYPESGHGVYKTHLRPALPDEIKSHLIAELAKRGIKEDVYYMDVVPVDGHHCTGHLEARKIKYYQDGDRLVDCGVLLYQKGKFARLKDDFISPPSTVEEMKSVSFSGVDIYTKKPIVPFHEMDFVMPPMPTGILKRFKHDLKPSKIQRPLFLNEEEQHLTIKTINTKIKRS